MARNQDGNASSAASSVGRSSSAITSVGHWCSHRRVDLRVCTRRRLNLYGWAKRLVDHSSGRDHRGPTVCPDGDHAAGGPSTIEFRSGHRPDLCDDDRWCWSLTTRSLNVSGCFQTTTTGNFRHHYPPGGNAGRLCNDNHVLNHQNQYERTVFMGFLDRFTKKKTTSDCCSIDIVPDDDAATASSSEDTSTDEDQADKTQRSTS